jgi:hypothetical protein
MSEDSALYPGERDALGESYTTSAGASFWTTAMRATRRAMAERTIA